MKLNREVFFNKVRDIFGGSLNQEQVNGCNLILDYYEDKQDIYTLPQLAYILATAFHETAYTMQPIAEYGKGYGKKYGIPDPGTGKTYYGRGYVQLTWKSNYKFQDDKLGLKGELVKDPNLAMQPAIALEILFQGMKEGDFTGKKLSDYINNENINFRSARKIINGLDKCDKIAGYAEKFLKALVLIE